MFQGCGGTAVLREHSMAFADSIRQAWQDFTLNSKKLAIPVKQESQ
jgi:hypothetical protein